MRFAYIHAEKANASVTALCRNLEVTRAGYYAYAARQRQGGGSREQQDARLREELAAEHRASRHTYGSPRLLQALRHKGRQVSKKRVERLWAELGMMVRRRRRFVVTTKADGRHRVEPNVLDRNFRAEQPNQRWVTDITYCDTAQGFAYLAVLLDLHSRAVVGWAVSRSLATNLPLEALRMAVRRRRPKPGLMHHSDRGCQYTSDDYRAALEKLGGTVSMSRKGNCWDNAVAESFFATVKTELIHRKRWANVDELRSALFDYIEVFYNRRRLHSSLGYRTPEQVEQAYQQTLAA